MPDSTCEFKCSEKGFIPFNYTWWGIVCVSWKWKVVKYVGKENCVYKMASTLPETESVYEMTNGWYVDLTCVLLKGFKKFNKDVGRILWDFNSKAKSRKRNASVGKVI